MADGGTFGGRDIAAIGRTRTARIFYQALTTRLTPAANYIDLADALVAACTDLAGDGDITLAHCASVRDATRATQMHLQPRQMAPRRAPVCGPGKRPADVFVDDLENPAAGLWQSGRLRGTRRGWYYPQNPNNDRTWDGTWASSGQLNLYAPNRASVSDAVMRGRQAASHPRACVPALRARLLLRCRCPATLRRRHRRGAGGRRPVARREGPLHARWLQRRGGARLTATPLPGSAPSRATPMAGRRRAWRSRHSPATG